MSSENCKIMKIPMWNPKHNSAFDSTFHHVFVQDLKMWFYAYYDEKQDCWWVQDTNEKIDNSRIAAFLDLPIPPLEWMK